MTTIAAARSRLHVSRSGAVGGIIVIWLIGYRALKGRSTLALARGGPSPNAAPSPTDLGRVDGVEVDEEEEEEGGLIRAVR